MVQNINDPGYIKFGKIWLEKIAIIPCLLYDGFINQGIKIIVKIKIFIFRRNWTRCWSRVGKQKKIPSSVIIVTRRWLNPKGGSHPRDRKKTSMQMNRPVEFSRRSATCATSACALLRVFVNTGCASTFLFLGVLVYGHVEKRIRGGERPSFPCETKLRGN